MTWFAVFSVGGWIYETVFAAVRRGRWENRGFLFGPVCPIYGTGAVGYMIIYDKPAVADGSFPWWAVFLTAMALSAILELTTSIVLERRFHARWWDYSNLPLNFQGRICLWAAMLFGGGGLAIVYLLLPPIKEITLSTPQWFWELTSLLVAAIMSADTVLTVDALNDLSSKLEESSQLFDERMEQRVASAHESASNAAAKVTETATSAVAKVTENASNAAARVSSTASNAAAKVASLPEVAVAKMESFNESMAQAQAEAKEEAAQERERQQALLAETLAEQAKRDRKAREAAAAREEKERAEREAREKARVEVAARERQERYDRETARELSFRQRYALRNIRAYDSEKTNRSAGRLRTFIAMHESPADAIKDLYAEARGRRK